VNGLGTDRTGQRHRGCSLKATLPRGSGTHLIHFPSTNKLSIVVDHIAELLEPTTTISPDKLSTHTLGASFGNVDFTEAPIVFIRFKAVELAFSHYMHFDQL
jgi:hypothetical protein